MRSEQPRRPLHWVGTSKDDLKELPEDVKDVIGFALGLVQVGDTPDNAKPLKGYRGASVLEIKEDYDTDTYRAVYTVRFQKAVYVLHTFKKRSKQGIKTPQKDLDLIKQRLKCAEDDYKKRYLA